MTSDEAEKLAAQDAYDRFMEEAESDPIRFIKHDTRAHDDEALYRLANRRGMALYGWYWLLVELLTGRKHHYYDVSDDAGWRRLARDMSCICDMGTDECKEFIAELYNASLINREQYDELQRVTITRILADARAYAESVASKKIGAWKTNRKKVFG
jgi:hypothetical protein